MLRLTTLLLLLPLAHSLLAQPSLRRPLSATPVARPIRVPTILAQEGGAFDQEGGRERSRSAVIAKPKPKAKAKNKEDVEKEGSWSVLLHNDDVRARQPAGPAYPPKVVTPDPPNLTRCTPSTTSTWPSCKRSKPSRGRRRTASASRRTAWAPPP